MLEEVTGEMKCEITFVGTLVWKPDYDGQVASQEECQTELDIIFDTTMSELLKLDGVEDPIMSGSLTTQTVEVTLLASGDSITTAITAGESALRTAFHTAGVGTPGWDDSSRASVDWRKIEADRDDTTSESNRGGAVPV